MLAEERFHAILQLLEEESFVTIDRFCDQIGASESTIRRDLSSLDKAGKLKRVHGGAASLTGRYSAMDEEVTERRMSNMEQKYRIAQYTATLIEDGDFIFIDSGSTTELIADYITAKHVFCATNSVSVATRATKTCEKVFLIGGEFKAVTEANVGANALDDLKKYNFSKGFFGANAVDAKAGYTTPDINEAMVKKQAFSHSLKRFVLADSSKMNRITSFTFGDIKDAILITTLLQSDRLRHATETLEVDKIL